MPHVITRPDGRCLALHGWIASPKGALHFRTKEEAADHATREKLTDTRVQFVPETPPPGVDPNGAAGVFGYRRQEARDV